MRISDWSSDVCSSDLRLRAQQVLRAGRWLIEQVVAGELGAIRTQRVDDLLPRRGERILDAVAIRVQVVECARGGEVVQVQCTGVGLRRQAVGERSPVGKAGAERLLVVKVLMTHGHHEQSLRGEQARLANAFREQLE